MKFCPQCGSELKEGARFCAGCGFQITVQQAPPPPPPAVPSQPSWQQPEPAYTQASQATNAFTDAVSGNTNLVQRVINLLTKPKQEWLVINGEKAETVKLLAGYVLVLSLIPALTFFIKYGVIGSTAWGVTYRSISGGISQALLQLLSALIGVYLFAWVIDLLAASFDSEKNLGKTLQLAAYAYTPIWILGILNLLGTFGSLLVFLGAVYTLYLMYLGIPVLKRTPQDKVTGYLVISIIALFVIYLVVALILGLLLGLVFVSGIRGI